MSALVRAAGVIIIVEEAISMKRSTDQSSSTNAGRTLVLAIGLGLLIFG